MSEFDEIYGDEFFVIDSDNLDEVNTKFYGYMISEDKVINNENIEDNAELTGLGAYVHIKTDENSINIFQDYAGCYGLYLFKEGNYFAISNSYIKLAEYLKNNHKLSLNKDFANSFLFVDLVTIGYNNTLINEINVIPRNYEITINKMNKSLSFNNLDFKENTISLDSKEGIKILDDWFNRWTNIIRSLKSKTNNIQVDLSGGYDTRIVTMIWLSANINTDKIFIKSIDNKHSNKKGIIEDYKIASEIANRFGFELNKNNLIFHSAEFNDMYTFPSLLLYLKLGFHKGFMFDLNTSSMPIYIFSGRGGALLRGYQNMSAEEYMNKYMKRFEKYGKEVVDSTERIINDSYNGLLKEFPDLSYDSADFSLKSFREIRNRHHFGKIFVNDYMINQIDFPPLFDPELHKLKLKTDECDDSNLLVALMFVRFRPDLLEFKFEGNRPISPETLDYARKLSEKYPYERDTYEYVDGPEKPSFIKEDFKMEVDGKYTELFKEIFNSHKFEFEFKKYYPDKFYDIIYEEVNRKHPYLNTAFAALSILNAISYTRNDSKNLIEWLDSFLESSEPVDDDQNKSFNTFLYPFKTAKIDLVKEGE